MAETSDSQHVQTGTTRDMNPCSIEFNRNAKGEPSWSIKEYYAPGVSAIDRIMLTDASLRELYRPDIEEAAALKSLLESEMAR